MGNIEKRVSSDGKTSYRVKVRLLGHPTQTATFERRSDAVRWSQQTEADIRAGRYFERQESRKHTFSELVNRYIETVLPLKPKIERSQTMQLNWWKQRLGNYLLADVTPGLITEHREALEREQVKRPDHKKARRRSPATVNRYLAALSHAFTVATNEWQWATSNPVRKLRKRTEPRGRVRYLSDEERSRLIEVCRRGPNRMLHPIVILALATGMRKAEILSLKWKDVDFVRHQIVLHDTKNGERRSVPLARPIQEILTSYLNESAVQSELVFPGLVPNKPIDIRAAWERALQDAKITDFRFHDLRHSAASYLAMNGSSPAVIAETLGHKTLSMVKRYAHLSESYLLEEVGRMNEKIFRS